MRAFLLVPNFKVKIRHLVLRTIIKIKRKVSMLKISEKELFRSSDLSLSAVLSMNCKIEALDKTEPQKVVFLFRREPGLDELVQAFWDRKLTVEPRAYFEAIKLLKSRIYQS